MVAVDRATCLLARQGSKGTKRETEIHDVASRRIEAKRSAAVAARWLSIVSPRRSLRLRISPRRRGTS